MVNGKKKAKCMDCKKDLGFKDYICIPDPYEPSGKPKPHRVNLCQKCFEERVDKKEKMLGNKDIEGEKETIVSGNEIMDMIKESIDSLPEEQQPTSKKTRKKKKLKKAIRREFIKKYKEKNDK